MKHIGYFQNWGLGDLVMTLPALTELRRLYPEAKITLVVRGGVQGALLKGNPLVDNIIQMPPRADKLSLAKFFLGLRRERFDVAFIGTRISPLLPLLLRTLTGVKEIVGDGQRAGFLYSLQVPVIEGVHRVDRMREVVKAYSGNPLGPVEFGLYLDEADVAAADAKLSDLGLERGGYVVIHAGSSIVAGTDKRIPANIARQLVTDLRAARPDMKIAMIFGPDEMDLVDRYAPYDDHLVAVTGTSLPVTQSILAGASVFVGTDSAPGHLAAAWGVPTFTVAGPTKPLETAPWGPRTKIITRHPPLECQPCWGTPRYGNCPYGVQCMQDLPERDLREGVLAAIASPAINS